MHMFLNDRYEESKNDEIPDCCLLSVEHTYQRWFGSFDQKNFYPTTITTNSLAKSTPVMEDLHQHLRDPCALQQASLPPILRNCITAIHTDTWFVVDGQDNDVCRTTAGSRPGDCFADTIFGYLWARVLRSLEQKCIEMSLLEAFPQQDGQPVRSK